MIGIHEINCWPKIGSGFVEKSFTTELQLEQWVIPAGVTVKLGQFQNFGIVAVPSGTKDVRGFVVPKSIFKY